MTDSKSNVDDWMNAFTKSIEQLAADSFRVELNGGLKRLDELPPDMMGSLLALIGEDFSIQLGFFATEDGCKNFTRLLLMMEPDEEEPTLEDVADALGEIVNIAAGVVKTAMIEAHPSITLGLPICLCGRIQTNGQMEVATGEIALGDESARLVILRSAK